MALQFNKTIHIPENIVDKDVDTNIFETKTGALNLAPVKISGQYKIVVTENNDLYFDDYNNKRVLINKGQRFLPQLANFLKTKSLIANYDSLKYGGFSNINKLSYHAPMYIGKNNLLPEYFIINNIGYGNKNELTEITDDTNLGNFSSLRKIINLKEIGLLNIFKEIIDSNNYVYPFYSDFGNHKLILYGFDYNKSTKTRKEISLLNYAANQNYFSSVNNYILNLFNDNNIIFPRFFNIEFEFSDSKVANNMFGNYYGFYSYGKNLKPIEFEYFREQNKYGIFTVEESKDNKITQVQTWSNLTKKYNNLLFSTNNLDTQNRLPLARIKINYLFDNDSLKIYDEYNTIYFEYLVNQNNIKSTHRETLIDVARSITKESEGQIICKLDSLLLNTLIFEINSNVENLYFKQSEQINQYEFIDLFNTDLNPKHNNQTSTPSKLFFKEISDNVICINNIFDTKEPKQLTGDYLKFTDSNKIYKINEYFIYENILCCKLVTDSLELLSIRNQNQLIQIYEEIDTKLFYHKPIPFLSYINDDIIIESNEQFKKDNYVSELKTKFNTPEFDLAINSFETFKVMDNKQFVNNYEASDYLYNSYPEVNKKQVLNMKFGNYGSTSFITNNLFNFDLNFYDTNSNVIYEQEDLDKIRFHWFLIKSETPKYLEDEKYHLSKLRYFSDKPHLSSKLIDTGIHCETIFLGVKYTLPRKYNNYLFSVYLEYDVVPDADIMDDDDSFIFDSYSFIVNNNEKTIYLKISKYLDFVDLIRGGKITNQPFLDLSFFYSIRQAYNTKSDLVFSFKSGGLLLCDDTIPTILNGEVTNDWKKKVMTAKGEKWLICLKRSTFINTSPLTDLIPQDGEVIFYVYSRFNNINYQSMSLKLTGIQFVGPDYVWCEDITIKYFDTKKLLINEWESLNESILYKFSSNPELLSEDTSYVEIDNSNITDSNLDNTFLTVLIGTDNKVFKILNTKKVFSLKENYIEKVRNVNYNNAGEKIVTDSIFKFNEFNGNLSEWETVKFDLDNTSNVQKITLFDRNQLWFLAKTIISTELKFKHNTESQTIKIINELLLSNLYEYANFNSIPIVGTNEYVKMQVVANDFNIVVWNIKEIDDTIKNKACKICRYSGPNIPILDELTKLSEFQLLKHNKNQLLNIFDSKYGNLKETKISDSSFNINNSIGYGNYHKQIQLEQTNSMSIISEQINYDINALGVWDEIKGNIISSLFIKTDDIETTLKYSNTNKYNTLTLLKTNIDSFNNVTVNQNLLEQLLFNGLFPDKNKEYISKFNYNLDEYIYNVGIEWLLNNFYYLAEIIDTDNKKIKFDFDNNSKTVEIDENNYQPNGTYKLIWKRK